jgi:gamma-glutamylcysteine synthetase
MDPSAFSEKKDIINLSVKNLEKTLLPKDVKVNNSEEDIALHMELFSLKEINQTLLKKIEELETRLKKYTNGDNHKRYYEKNKQKIKESGSLYLQKLKTENPDKIKEYSRAAYARKKEKAMLEELKNSENVVIKRDSVL